MAWWHVAGSALVKSRFYTFVTALALSGAAALPALALSPADIAVIYNSRSTRSADVAKYYAKARGLQDAQLIGVAVDAPETIPEAVYRERFLPAVKKGLEERGLTDKVRCLVTVNDIPLRIGEVQIDAVEASEANAYRKQFDEAVASIQDCLKLYAAIGSTPPATNPAATSPDKPALPALVTQAAQAVNDAAKRIERLPAAERGAALKQLADTQQKVFGLSGLLATFQVRPEAPEAADGKEHLDQIRKQLRELEEKYRALTEKRDTPDARKAMVELRLQTHGLAGAARQLDDTISYLQPRESSACLDSELMLALEDQTYSRTRWQPNPFNVEINPFVAKNRKPRVLLVSRIDGPTAEFSKELIDRALEVEKNGLNAGPSNIYLDARGIRDKNSYGQFDEDLRQTAEWLKNNGDMPVTLDDRGELFDAEKCPDAALYCGWYALRNYKESCQWKKGAVGYHVASFEMATLRDVREKGWVYNLLRDGFAGTMGATDEPYLHSFPKPSLFFPLLMCGEFTQGEVYLLTTPMTSWRVGMVGDPLYNPFAKKPAVAVEKVKTHPIMGRAWQILRDTGKPAATQSK